MSSFTNINSNNDRINKMIDFMQSKENATKMGGFYNDNIFKAIQSKILNARGNTGNMKETITPKSNKKNTGGFSQRTGSFKTAFPISTYNSTFSPRSLKSNSKRDRNSICSPISMKAFGCRSKKSATKMKNSTSK